ncbi:MAG: MMPL family transporter [Intestinibacter bartlettii]|uniref:efflux RND transporter permease subunit n=1 Tax=Intestinibacter bartlettii TaxID=261299 RepID=UPI0026ED8807|nr:MMPL family transporter [Intestinibacter bartlettii]MDO5010408.1 MMPL family transporter [Intestinibacter bartlettii]
MRKLYESIVNHKKTVIVAFVIAMIVSAFCSTMVNVNYDINDYLPDGTASTVALDTMNEEYDMSIPNARVMISNVTVTQALEMKQKLSEIEGVEDVTWLDDVIDTEIPLETADKDTVENYYKDNNALFTVTINEHTRIETVNAIRDLIGDDNSMAGAAINTAIAAQATNKEVKNIIFLVIPICLAVLFLTSSSWIEPILLLGSIGVAILLNKGSNLMFGTISFVTNAAGGVLQLAVSMDYSIFLLHRFQEMREEGQAPKEAMINALCKSTGSILSSGLTTVIGFAALILMRFKIGPDMGLAMAKAIFLSLITVFVLFPVVLLYCYPLIDKTKHKSLLPDFGKFGQFVTKLMVPAVLIFVLFIIPCNLGQKENFFSYGSSQIFSTDTQIGSDTKKIEDTFGKSNNLVLMVPKGDLEKETELSKKLHDMPQVSSILSYVDNAGAEVPMDYLDNETLSKLISENYSRLVLTVDADFEGEATFNLIDEIRSLAKSYYGDEYLLAGESASTYDLMDTITKDNDRVNLIAIGAVFFVLLLSMKSITIPVILVLAIETAIWINLSVPYFTNDFVFYIAYLIISSVQLGATVDYAILLTSRYMEVREKASKKQTVVETLRSTTVSIMTSASILTIAGMLLWKISTHGILSQLGHLLARGTALSTIIVLFVIPGMLYIFDGLIQKTTVGVKFYNKKEKGVYEKEDYTALELD